MYVVPNGGTKRSDKRQPKIYGKFLAALKAKIINIKKYIDN